MARPKSGKTPKRPLTLTVSKETREDLGLLSSYYNESISALVSDWAARGAKLLETHADQTDLLPGRAARQKSEETPLQNLNITVSDEARANLKKISSYLCTSISFAVSEWAKREAGALRQRAATTKIANKEGE